MKSRLMAGVAAVSLVLGMVVVSPMPAQAACDTDTLYFATGTSYKYSTTGTASSGTCSDVNMYYYVDGDGCNSETIAHRGYWYSPNFFEWIPGTLGYVTSSECNYDSDNPLLTNVATGTQYKFRSQQSGGYAKGLD